MADTQERTPRASDSRKSESRETEKREVTFTPQFDNQMLPTPEPKDGIDYRYVRLASRGEVDGRNYSTALRGGWVPVARKDVPELEYVLSDMNHPLAETQKDAIVVGGLILCQRASEIGEQRQAVADEEVKRQIQALNENYMNEGNDPRMNTKFNESKSSVRFGD